MGRGTMYDSARVFLAAIHAAKSAADETVRTMPYRFGLPASLVYGLDKEVVLRDGLRASATGGAMVARVWCSRPRFVSLPHFLTWRVCDVFSPCFHQSAPFFQHVGAHVGLRYRVSNSMR